MVSILMKEPVCAKNVVQPVGNVLNFRQGALHVLQDIYLQIMCVRPAKVTVKYVHL